MRIGSLFSGYGGLDMAVQSVLGGEVTWYSEIDKAACQVLAAHHPGVPNLGDITRVDWAAVPNVDILTGGYPCQPFSHAGQRKGTDDNRHLWPYVRDAIGALRPMVTVLENVDGHRSLGMDIVLGDLAAMGMSARWGVVRAADAGAPHGRARLFIVAHPSGTRSQGFSLPAAPVHGAGQERAGADGGAELPADAPRGVGGTWSGRGVPEPQGTAGSAAHAGGAAADAQGGRRGAGPRPAEGTGRFQGAGAGDGSGVDWGKYAPAIHRWERVLGRPAPSPTIPGANGRPRLSPSFVEWMMGLPEGHVTGHGLKPAACLKMLGNGVVPQQADLALRALMPQ